MNGTVKPLEAKNPIVYRHIRMRESNHEMPANTECGRRVPGGIPYTTSECFAKLDPESRDCFRKRGAPG
jgi:hypothetical protein